MQVPQPRARRRRVAVAVCVADQGRPDATLRGPAHHDGWLRGRGALLLLLHICLMLPPRYNGSRRPSCSVLLLLQLLLRPWLCLLLLVLTGCSDVVWDLLLLLLPYSFVWRNVAVFCMLSRSIFMNQLLQCARHCCIFVFLVGVAVSLLTIIVISIHYQLLLMDIC